MQKNLNDIIPPSRRRTLGVEGSETPTYTSSGGMPPVPPPERPAFVRPERAGKPRRKFPVGTAIIALVVIALSVGALFAFADANVDVVATESASSVSGEFIATAGEGDLPFEVITVEKVATASVPSEGTETVNQAAQGTITIENKQDTVQQLIKNTRFETSDGKIFRIRDSVTVPASRNGTPGTLQATVYADAAGADYNVGPTTFTLPGLSGTATYTLVTARSAEAMKGGFSGPRPSISEATREARAASLRTSLESEIAGALEQAVPEGYVLVKGGSSVAYEPEPDQAGATGSVEISEKAIATAVVFPEAALARAIAFQVVGAYTGQPVHFKDASGLTLTPVGDIPVPGTTEFAFSLAGNTTIAWDIDTNKIAAAVAGKNKQSAETLLSGFPEVAEATLVLRPFWATTFPQDPAKVDVTVANGPEKQ